MKTKVRNQNQLAKALGVSRQLIAHHVKSGNAPPLSDVHAWAEYLAAHGRDGSVPPELKPKFLLLRLAILQETERKLTRDNAHADGRLIDRSSVVTGCREAMALTFGELERLFLSELPPIARGLDEHGIKAEAERLLVELMATAKPAFEKIGRQG